MLLYAGASSTITQTQIPITSDQTRYSEAFSKAEQYKINRTAEEYRVARFYPSLKDMLGNAVAGCRREFGAPQSPYTMIFAFRAGEISYIALSDRAPEAACVAAAASAAKVPPAPFADFAERVTVAP